MAENENGTDKSEQATPEKVRKSKEKGQVARSKELATASVLIAAALSMFVFGDKLAYELSVMMKRAFTFERADIYSPEHMWHVLVDGFSGLGIPVFLILLMLFIISILGSSLLGGMLFSTKAMMPKFSRMSPKAGFKRMFGMQAWVELIKSILKVTVVMCVAWAILAATFEHILHLSISQLPGSAFEALDMLSWMFLLLCLSLLVIVAVDVPYQIYKHNDELKMTKQEVKDEFRNSEGKPEVKQRIRQLQYEMSQRTMMGDVPDADVIVTNPTHYSVALKYDKDGDRPPYVVAKGVDFMALKIREVGREHEVPVMQSPQLCRAVYHTTDIGEDVPEELFIAIAKILAYIYQLEQFRKGKSGRPKALPTEIPVPDDFLYPN
ncbi:flagellar biosynthesis protein FlhB [Psychromonas sp. 14N.309.X.WAT.B.A12]|uniref:flagellar biosynthesis protein FlhB n=1 Tax=Psychromonas sp. 14N.309.X.WAT.B.A12 TaxID=2998322 RepID=UPI0025AF26D4|nr:flagellar biosynthesis protein FlhB [Psychromonas sp. 14N.309.X.WAT.B.A12]MDN2662847.1 flagellar biosynthesis protein FlhB [Psychromonas sp. 14N.309.X.WAT.B.A12]